MIRVSRMPRPLRGPVFVVRRPQVRVVWYGIQAMRYPAAARAARPPPATIFENRLIPRVRAPLFP
ncbi:hypothetical protein [Luteimonas sp. FCS-9]|uniref:hypothetical protein n=1 Tax=Luteimonas sp. FCS-9 TaxID=1547516 RepID=UPI00063EADB3|nr:hypothetical protein [Luteimonas sp. FCS-9]KLI97112.1 hypothetical protein WQ56_17330 [Luteimonas sp. FCS-9]